MLNQVPVICNIFNKSRVSNRSRIFNTDQYSKLLLFMVIIRLNAMLVKRRVGETPCRWEAMSVKRLSVKHRVGEMFCSRMKMALCWYIDGVCHLGFQYIPEFYHGPDMGQEWKQMFRFHSSPISGSVALKRITVCDVAPAPSIWLSVLASHLYYPLFSLINKSWTWNFVVSCSNHIEA